jgi:pilus assembly protein CpaE
MITVLLSENQPGDIDRIAAALGEVPEMQVVAITRDGLETVQTIAGLRPQVALVRWQMPGMDGLRVCRMASVVSPQTVLVLVVDTAEQEAELVGDAMSSGARGVIHLRTDPSLLVRRLEELVGKMPRQEDEEWALATDPSRTPVTISVTGAKGGIGKTTLTTNLAVVLAQRNPGQVVLVDFVGQYGDSNLLLDLGATSGILDLTEYDELDADLVRSRLARHASGLFLLGGVNGTDSLSSSGTLTLPYVANLLGVLRREFRYLVFDIPPLVHPLSNYVFLRSSFVLVVTSLLDLSSIRNTSALLGSLVSSQLPADRVRLVVSRADGQNPFGLQDLEQAAKHKVYWQIPNAPEVATTALNSGVPYVLSRPTSAVAKAVEKLADMLTPVAAVKGAKG